VDGELGDRARREVEARLAGDPARGERLATWREAMDLWREDARRGGPRVEPPVLADRVLRAGRPTGADPEVSRAARAYAAAAVVLIGLGVGGAAWLGPGPAPRAGPPREAAVALRLLEEERMALQVVKEWERFALTEQGGSPEER
jgi:anti-sigma factor RsiW